MAENYIEVDNQKLPIKKNEEQLLRFLIDHKVDIDHSCGGFGTCGTCRVLISNHETLPPRNPIEMEMAKDRSFTDNERLACQNPALAKLIVQTPKVSSSD